MTRPCRPSYCCGRSPFRDVHRVSVEPNVRVADHLLQIVDCGANTRLHILRRPAERIHDLRRQPLQDLAPLQHFQHFAVKPRRDLACQREKQAFGAGCLSRAGIDALPTLVFSRSSVGYGRALASEPSPGTTALLYYPSYRGRQREGRLRVGSASSRNMGAVVGCGDLVASPFIHKVGDERQVCD
jgi:hypothetical protein